MYLAEVGFHDDLLQLVGNLRRQSADQYLVIVGRQRVSEAAHEAVQVDDQLLNERILRFVAVELLL